ncbi:MAG TPA: hypothetical protein VF618_11405 [Thermoanaerobaculia bacterium]
MVHSSLRVLCVTGVALAMLLVRPAVAEMRPLSEAERAAVQIAAGYLSRGPAAVHEQLAAKSPLRRFDEATALQEIEARLGPPAGASWELQTVVPALKDRNAVFTIEFPSGFDDTVVWDFVEEDGVWKVDDLRILAQESNKAQVFPPLPKKTTAADDAEAKSEPPYGMLILIGLVGAGLAAAAAFLENEDLTRPLLGGGVVIMVAATLFAVMRDGRFSLTPPPPPPAVEKKDTGYPKLASILPLRRALASGDEISSLKSSLPRKGITADVATLWMAEADLQQMKIPAVKDALKRFPSPSNVPLAEILRARVALFENDEAAAAIAYEHAVNLGPGRDGLWVETAQSLRTLGFDDRASGYLSRLAKIGSRRADVYYSLSVLSATTNKLDEASSLLKQAWALRPAERAEVVSAAVLWSVLRRADAVQTISLSTPNEAVVPSPVAGSRSIVFPLDAMPRISGEFLHVQIGQQELHVPGGACLAPIGTPIVEANTWAQTEEEQGLNDVPSLLPHARNTAVYAQPALRSRIVRSANALGNRNRWQELVQLTDGLQPTSEHVPADLFFLRSIALQRLDRNDEAKQLLTGLASGRVLQRKRDVQSLTQLAELLASFNLYDQAIKTYDRAQTIRPQPFVDDRVRQLEMNKRLATKYTTMTTPHFEIRYPEDVAENFAKEIANVLEGEYARLQKWIPTPNFQPVIVNVLWWREFRATYTGTDFILGFYQSRKITIPYAGIGRLEPPLVAILSHELAHALIAQATNDHAPRWFQEGLAQRIEMVPYHENAFNMYTDDRLLAVSLLDAVLTGSPDPEMITEAYVLSQTLLRYVEAKYGAAGIAKMLASFRAGATTEEAIRQLSGQSMGEFDQAMRTWGRSATSRVFENPPPLRYDLASETGLAPSEQRGPLRGGNLATPMGNRP